MSALSRHLSSREAGLIRALRSALRERHHVAWRSDDEVRELLRNPARDFDGAPTGEEPDWLTSPRRRMNYCIRRRVKRLRATRAMRAEYRSLRGRA